MRKRLLEAALPVALALSALPPGAAGAAGTGAYVVQPGDTLYSLARKSGTTVAQLMELNAIGPDFIIRVGQSLTLPAGGTGGTAAGTAAVADTPVPVAAAALVTTTGSESKKYATVRPADESNLEFAAEGGVTATVLVGTAGRVEAIQRPLPPVGAENPVAEVSPANPSAEGAPVPGQSGVPAAARVIPVTEEERLLLARLVTGEAGNEPPEGQLAVAAVVVNRVRHPSFPKTVSEVIREPGQFKAVELGRVEGVTPSAEVLEAVDRALAGEDPSKGAIFFYNPAKSVAMDFWRTRPVTVVIGGHNFAR